MPGDEERRKAQDIIAQCKDDEEFDWVVVHYAKIMMYLVCHKARQRDLQEASIRWLYAEFAEMAVQELADPGTTSKWN